MLLNCADPDVTADIITVSNPHDFETIFANDVFPHPGGPHNIIDCGAFKFTPLRLTPTRSSSDPGLNNSARGLR